MERKAFNSLNEAALQVQLDERFEGKSKRAGNRLRSQMYGDDADVAEIQAHNERRKKAGTYPKKKEVEQTRSEILANQPKFDSKGRRLTRLGDHVEYDEVDAMVLEYFSNYFGDNLNEDTSDEDIMNAVYDLIDLTEAVLEVLPTKPKPKFDKEKFLDKKNWVPWIKSAPKPTPKQKMSPGMQGEFNRWKAKQKSKPVAPKPVAPTPTQPRNASPRKPMPSN